MRQLNSQTPHCLIVTGLPGSGKTTFASAFSKTFSAPFLDTVLFYDNVDEPARARALVGEMYTQLLRSQRSIIVEPVMGSRSERVELAKMAKEAGYTPLTVWVQTEPSICRRRSTVSTRSRPAMYDDESYEKAVKRFTAPVHGENHCVISGMHTQATQMRVVLKRLSDQTGRSNVSLTRAERTEPKPTRTRLVQ